MSIHVVTEELCSVCEIVGVCVRARLTSNLQPWEKNISFDSTEKSNEFRVTWRLDSLLHYCKYPGADWLFSTQTEQHVLFHFVKKKIGKSVHPKFQYTDTFEMLGSTVWVRLKKWLKWWNQLAKLLQTSFKSVNGLIYSNCLRSKNKFESLWKLLNKKQHIALLISHWNHHRINSSCSWVKAKKRLLAVLTVWKTTTPVTVCKPTQSAVYEKKKKVTVTHLYTLICCVNPRSVHMHKQLKPNIFSNSLILFLFTCSCLLSQGKKLKRSKKRVQQTPSCVLDLVPLPCVTVQASEWPQVFCITVKEKLMLQPFIV